MFPRVSERVLMKEIGQKEMQGFDLRWNLQQVFVFRISL